MLKRVVLSLLVAGVLVLTSATPLLAFTHAGPSWEWVSGAAGDGYDANVPVCLMSNFDGPNSGWDDVGRINRVHDALKELNAQGLDVHYYRTDKACSNVTGPHLNVGWADPGPLWQDGAHAVTGKVETVPFCITHCLKVAEILLDPEFTIDMISGGWPEWYTGESGNVPSNKMSLRQVVQHELGHSSGLGESNDIFAIMCAAKTTCQQFVWQYGPGYDNPNYNSDDYDGLRQLWGVK